MSKVKQNTICFYALIAAIILAIIIMVAMGRATEGGDTPFGAGAETEIVCADPDGIFCAREYKEKCLDKFGIFCKREAPAKNPFSLD